MTTTIVTAAPAQAQAATYTSRRRQIAVLVVALAFVMDLMDATLLTIALPTIPRGMHASLPAVNWMATAYPLAFAVLLITGGRLGEVFGYRRLFLAGVTAFLLASLLVGLAWSPEALIAARLLQGAAAALMVPQVLSIVQLLYRAEERTTVAGLLGGLTLLATTVAPVVLIKANLFGLSWRPIFLINVPVCVAALPLAARYLPVGGSARRQRVDLAGTALVILAVLLLVLPLIQGRALGWPGWCVAMLAAAAPVFGLFAWGQHRSAVAGGGPLISPALFRHRSFTVGLGISLLVTATIACFGLTFSLLMQSGDRYSAVHTVLTALFLTLGMTAVAGPLSKKVIPALGRWSLTAGVAATATHPHLSTWQLAPGCACWAPAWAWSSCRCWRSPWPACTPTRPALPPAWPTRSSRSAARSAWPCSARCSSTTSPAPPTTATPSTLQVVLLTACAALSIALPRRIAAGAYQPTL